MERYAREIAKPSAERFKPGQMVVVVSQNDVKGYCLMRVHKAVNLTVAALIYLHRGRNKSDDACIKQFQPGMFSLVEFCKPLDMVTSNSPPDDPTNTYSHARIG